MYVVDSSVLSQHEVAAVKTVPRSESSVEAKYSCRCLNPCSFFRSLSSMESLDDDVRSVPKADEVEVVAERICFPDRL